LIILPSAFILFPMLSPYGKREWLMILGFGAAFLGPCIYLHAWTPYWWVPAALIVIIVLALLSFFRDPPRRIPDEPGAMISPADGVISSIHEVEQFAPFGGKATCVRIFLSVLNVHVNRSPCAAKVGPITYVPGEFISALNPRSALVNESNLIVLLDPATDRPVCAVRQVSGAIARRIVCQLTLGQVLARGERFGMIKFGSTTELYLPQTSSPRANVIRGQRVFGGKTILAYVS
jgi:phosphatidylserine decarboxylase